MLNPIIIGYCPPPGQFNSDVFMENVRRFRTRYPLVLLSDHSWPDTIRVKDPSPVIRAYSDNRWAINNVLWLTSLKIAAAQKATHILYLESDCRVGMDYWDDAIFTEFFSAGRPLICGGSLAVFNPCNSGPVAASRWLDLVKANHRPVPIPAYGWKGQTDLHASCVFPNGALAVYDMAWMAQMFSFENIGNLVATMTAFDMQVGKEIWAKFGEDSYSLVGQLNTMFSSCGDVLTTEAQRLEWLRLGRFVAVHQVKSGATL